MLKKTIFDRILLFFLGGAYVLCPGAAWAQQAIFQTSTQTKNNLTQTQISRYEKSEFSDVTGAISFIHINDFAQQVADQVLEIQVPGDNHLYLYHARYVWSLSLDDITWYGDLTDSSGYASFQFKDGELFGYFNIEDKDYFIRPLGNNDYILVELAEQDAPICGYSSQDFPTKDIEEKESQQASDRGENCDVKVLVLYTSRAAEDIDNISTFVSGLIAQSNQALRNSAITLSELTFILAGKALLSDFTESGIISADLTALRTSPTVTVLRNSFKADCVVLLTDGDYSSNGNVFLGLTPVCGPAPALSFSIVEADAAASRMTFAHELAHQFGCKHSPGNSNGTCDPNYERPHWFHCKGSDRYTIMEAGVKKKQRIPHFSNPDVDYHGHATGTHAGPSGSVERDNARQLREQACIVGQYQSSNDLYAIIYGDDFRCITNVSFPVALNAQVSGGGPGAYTFLWQQSLDGINYDPSPVSTTAFVTVTLAPTYQPGDIFFLRLIVGSGTGQTFITFWEIRVLPKESYDCDGEKPAILNTKIEENTPSFSINPNPADNYISIIPNTKNQDDFSIDIFSVLSRFREHKDFSRKDESNSGFNFNIGHLPSGTYFVCIKSKELYETRKLIIVH